MRITVRLFAGARDAAGSSTLNLTVPAGATIHDVAAEAVRQVPALARLAGIARYARNLEYVPDTTPVADGDEIALIPPVSGGYR